MKHCPYCQGGQDKRTYTEAGLVDHLRKFHRKADYADITELSFRLAKEDIWIRARTVTPSLSGEAA
jgi:hypothetical protein